MRRFGALSCHSHQGTQNRHAPVRGSFLAPLPSRRFHACCAKRHGVARIAWHDSSRYSVTARHGTCQFEYYLHLTAFVAQVVSRKPYSPYTVHQSGDSTLPLWWFAVWGPVVYLWRLARSCIDCASGSAALSIELSGSATNSGIHAWPDLTWQRIRKAICTQQPIRPCHLNVDAVLGWHAATLAR